MSFSIAGKTAIVTGATSGIGLAFARLLASRGANVVAADLHETDAFKSFTNEKRRTKVLFKKTDVTDWDQLRDLFRYTKSNNYTVDLLANIAGVYEPAFSNFWNDTETSSYKSIDINLAGLIQGTRLAIHDQMTRSKGRGATETQTTGVVLNISSLAGQYALFNQPIYSATKAGVSAFTRSLAPLHKEFGIKVVGIAPGMIWTPLWANDPEKMKAIGHDDVFLQPEELAEEMLKAVESADVVGGKVVEVLKTKTRLVEVDSPLPEGPGSTMSNMGRIYDDTMALLESERKRESST
ncbi:hypothetical protein LTR47_009901 [Exophiala xenobiotica]|nr:hypothetical protein LTR47_009901 [Exophiala xenobiotica]KAK5243926.1 hypothetical protein LTS06_010402 [Exophiala xenobiotica]KAK5282190.1 hypothetical protein LTR40_003672 [Exophiala xenobiotica]KAK5347943.1 hypothetical protein LTR61_008195 [Exophiala xenobiotica]KAK5361448.1 hypothetical protein LTS03_010401 [Exophiala xenobiotica]